MTGILKVSPEMLGIYRERNHSPDFWAEPFNALTNLAFVIAAVLATDLAVRRKELSNKTIGLLATTACIGVGSFLFHTVPNPVTLWMDVIPIAIFQLSFLYLATSEMLSIRQWISVVITVAVVALSFVFFPIKSILNGSLFYFPSLIALLSIGIAMARRSGNERFNLLFAGGTFAIAIIARSLDQEVGWSLGTHFLWHSLNGLVIYLSLRAWIICRSRPLAASDSS